MKAISVRQPWAWAIAQGQKRIENRSWFTSYRGPLLIHAAGACTVDEYEDAAWWIREHGLPPIPPLDQLDRGGFVARARLVEVVQQSVDPWFVGPFGFVLADVEPLPFAKWGGALGIFEVPSAAQIAMGLG